MSVSGRFGSNDSEPGVLGHNDTFQGVSGTSNSDTGVFGGSGSFRGVHGDSPSGSGVFATTKSGQGVTTFSTDSIGIFAQGGFWAGVFNGPIAIGKGPAPSQGVTPNVINNGIVINDGGSIFLNGGGDVILGSGDCAEDFTVAGTAEPEPGTVMVLGEDQDKLSESYEAYDKRVVGVISGAGSYKPGLVLDRQPDQKARVPIALLGKVYCKVDARYGEIRVGDLLCTSPTRGHAMKASDPQRAFGAIIGKALRPLANDCALIPILVALQ